MTEKISDDIDKLTDLSLSVGQQGRKNKGIQRPLTPIEVAQYIKQLKEETGESDADISKRLGLGKPKLKEGRMEDIYVEKASDSQVKLFLKLLRIDEKSVRLIGFQGDPGKCVFSTAVLLATYPPEVQNAIIQSVIKQKLGKEEVRAILQYMKKYKLSIEDSIEKITKKRVQTFELYKLAYNITSSVAKVLSELGKTEEEISEKIIPKINKKLDSKIEGVVISENLLVIDMDSETYKIFLKRLEKTKMTYNNYIKDLIIGE